MNRDALRGTRLVSKGDLTPRGARMSTNTRSTSIDRLFDSLAERQATLFDLARNGVERNHRFARSLIEGARQNARDWTEVTRRWVTNPTDLVGVYEAVTDAIGNSQARTLALTRELIEDWVESQREGREAIRRSFGDVREAMERVQEAAPSFLRRGVLRREDGKREPVAEQQSE